LLTDSPLDEMIQIVHERESKRNQPPPRGIRRIVYKNVADVPRLLDTTQPVLISNLRVNAPEFVPKPRLLEAPATEEAEPDQEIEDLEVEDSDIINATSSTDTITIPALPVTNVPPSKEQIRAAVVFQTYYRKVLRLKRKATKITPLDICRTKCFEDCLKESACIDWPKKSFYRFLFLGPLPHALTCLATAEKWVHDNKKRNKDRFKKGFIDGLCHFHRRKTIDKIKSLQKALAPSAKLHQKRDVEELKKLVTGVEALLPDIALNVARELEEDMALAMKGIVAAKRPPKLKSKPQLRMDDEDYNYEREEVKGLGVKFEPPVVFEESVAVIINEREAGKHMEETVAKPRTPATVMQSVPWVEVGETEDEINSSEPESLVMQSLPWVAIMY